MKPAILVAIAAAACVSACDDEDARRAQMIADASALSEQRQETVLQSSTSDSRIEVSCEWSRVGYGEWSVRDRMATLFNGVTPTEDIYSLDVFHKAMTVAEEERVPLFEKDETGGWAFEGTAFFVWANVDEIETLEYHPDGSEVQSVYVLNDRAKAILDFCVNGPSGVLSDAE